MTHPSRPLARVALSALSVVALAACEGGTGFPADWDLRSRDTLTTAEAARAATAPRPQADNRGVISYPGYQVAVARRGDTVRSVAGRLGVSAEAMAARNAIQPDVVLQGGEVLLIPGRVAEPSPATGVAATGPIRPPGSVDVAAIATTALDRAAPPAGAAPAAPAPAAAPATGAPGQPPRIVVQTGREPQQHRVARGESAYTIARRYGVPVRALAEWNGLAGPDYRVREGQTLLIPPFAETPPPPPTAVATTPGQGSPTPVPPSATRPLPAEKTTPAAAPVPVPPSPELGAGRTAASAARFAMPADGPVIRAFSAQRPGIDIGAPAGAAVRAAEAGTVLRVTRETNGITLVLLRHEGNIVTVYANVADVTVAQGDTVRRGQQIARVAPGDRPFLRFDVRRGVDAVDPMEFLR
jgi:murein DD-endopeptidase MepM/ murein hydrolase activator NlpD